MVGAAPAVVGAVGLEAAQDAADPAQSARDFLRSKQANAASMSRMAIDGGASPGLWTHYRSQLISHVPGAKDIAEASRGASLTSVAETRV